jgi:hypothetical protein
VKAHSGISCSSFNIKYGYLFPLLHKNTTYILRRIYKYKNLLYSIHVHQFENFNNQNIINVKYLLLDTN